MEWDFKTYWSILVEEAKQCRKGKRISQEKLAILAGVSVPTVINFEKGDKKMGIETCIKILRVLGMSK